MTRKSTPLAQPTTWGGGSETVNYVYDDGTVDDGIGITGVDPFDILWLNRFTVQPGGERITHIEAAFGSPGDTRPYNGTTVSILLYNDPDGGSVTNASLVAGSRIDTTITNANTGIINVYDIPDSVVSGQFLVGAVARNLPGGNGFVASFDNTLPHTSGASYAGFTAGAQNPLTEGNLATIPAGQFGTIEGFGLPGNWVVRARGEVVPEPTSLGLVGLGGLLLALAHRRR
jgi:hypothetical protein